MGVHTVVQGECLASIAHRYGFAWQTIYNAPENTGLREKRPNPNVLYPGDAVVIPEMLPVGGTVMTGRQHEFRVHRPAWVLRLRLSDHGGSALEGLPYTLVVDGGETLEGTVDATGMIVCAVPPDGRRATLHVLDLTFPIRLGALDPISQVSGVQARLNNLGYHAGPVDGVIGPRTRRAVYGFQRAHGLKPTGRLDDATRSRVLAVHDNHGECPPAEHPPDLEDPAKGDEPE